MFLVAVALSSNHVLIYNDKNVVDCFQTDDAVSAMKFGRFGREENTLVIGKHGCYKSGQLFIDICFNDQSQSGER